MTQEMRCQTIEGLEHSLACTLIFKWVKSNTINMVQFIELVAKLKRPMEQFHQEWQNIPFKPDTK